MILVALAVTLLLGTEDKFNTTRLEISLSVLLNHHPFKIFDEPAFPPLAFSSYKRRNPALRPPAIHHLRISSSLHLFDSSFLIEHWYSAMKTDGTVVCSRSHCCLVSCLCFWLIRIASNSRRFVLSGCLLVLCAGLTQPATTVLAKDVDDLFDEMSSRPSGSSAQSESDLAKASNADNGLQWRGQIGHLAFPTFGRDESITHIEMLPVVLFDDSALFTDFRLFVDNNGQVGGNLGFGYRQYVSGIDQVLGASLWYDADNSLGELFQQGGLSLEALGDDWDLRSNLYLPFTTSNQTFSVTRANSRFSGNQILFDQIHHVGQAMRGVDVEFGVQLPTDFARDHELRIYAGAYHFQGDSAPDIDGYRARLQGDITDNISAQVEYTRDDTFGSNVIVGGSITLPGSLRGIRAASDSSRRHLQRFTQRNYNVIVSRSQTVTSDIVAMNAATGNAFSVQHVSSSGMAGPSGTGTATNPFASVAEAQTFNPDLLFVHAGSVLNEDIVLQDGQSLLGEGISHTIQAAGYGTIVLPTATAGTALPVLQSVADDAIKLASNNRVAGFTIDNPIRHGVFGTGIANATLSDLTIRGAGQDNLFLQNVTGTMSLTNVTLGDATGASLHIDGADANLAMTGSIANTIGRTVEIENLAADKLVNLTSTTIQDSGAGLLFANNDGDVLLNNVTVLSSTGTGIEISGGEGDLRFAGTTAINAANGPAIRVQDAEGTVLFDKVNVTTNGQTGLFVRNATSFLIGNGDINTSNGGAIADIEGSATDIRLRSIFANGGAFGVRIVDSTGSFGVYGNTSPGTGGLIQNTTVAVQLQNAGTALFQLVDFDANQTVVSDVGSSHVAFNALRVTNTPSSAGTAIFSLRNTKMLELASSTFSDNDLRLLDASFDTVNSYVYAVNGNTLTSDVGDLFRIASLAGAEGSTLTLQASNNVITLNPIGAKAFDVNWNGTLFSTLSGNSIHGVGGSNVGLLVNNSSTTALTTVTAANNTFSFDGGNDTAVNVLTAGAGTLSVASNSFDFNGANGTAMSFTLLKASDVVITSNLLNDDGSGATAVLFNSMANLSRVQLDNNLFKFNSSSVALDRGVILSNIETGGSVTLFGTVNNTISGATTPYFIPAGMTTGGFFVNGSIVP